jgi:hypothetical protein
MLAVLAGALALLLAVIMLLAAAGTKSDAGLMVGLGAVYGLLGAAQLAAGLGLWTLRPWGRALQVALSWLGLLGIPCGTIVGIFVLRYLYKPGVKLLFSGRDARALTPEERAQLAAVLPGSAPPRQFAPSGTRPG